MRFGYVWLLLVSLPIATSLVVRQKASSSTPAGQPFKSNVEAYVIGRSQDAGTKAKWTQTLNNSFSSLTFSDAVYIGRPEIESLVGTGEVASNYSSWYVKAFDRRDVMKNPKFQHELGCTLAHRKVWQRIVDRFDAGETAPWAAVFEGDAILRRDFSQRALTLQSQLASESADIILMGHCFESCPSSLVGASLNLGANVHAVPSTSAVCTHAYLVSASGAKRLLGLTVPMKMAVDERIRAATQKGRLQSLSVCPPISRQPWQVEAEMFAPQVDGAVEFVRRGGNASDFTAFMDHVQKLQL